MGKIISLENFIKNYRLAGNWKLSYTDSTHLKNDVFLDLGTLEIQGSDEDAAQYLFLPFTFTPKNKSDLGEQITSLNLTHANAIDSVTKPIIEALEESICRTGLDRLQINLKLGNSSNKYETLPSVAAVLNKNPFVVLVTDTGAIKRGIISLFLSLLKKTTLLVVLPMQVIYEIQDKAETLKGVYNKKEFKTNHILVNQRPIETFISREIERTKELCPIEFLHSSNTLWDKAKNWSGDRVIIETAKSIRQDRNLLKEVFLATGDKTVFSLSHLQGLNSIYVRQFPLRKKYWSAKLNIFEKTTKTFWSACSVHNFIWDLVHSFSVINLENDNIKYQISYYYEDRLGWTDNVLKIERINK
jgi:hypothetical protein